MPRSVKSVVALAWFLFSGATWSTMCGIDFGPLAMILFAPLAFACAWLSAHVLCTIYWKESFHSVLTRREPARAKN